MSSQQLREIEDKLRSLLPIPEELLRRREEHINKYVASQIGGQANHPGTPDVEKDDIGIEAKKKIEDRDVARELVRKLKDTPPYIKRRIPLVYTSIRQDLKDWIEGEINSEVICNSVTPVGTKGGNFSRAFSDDFLLEVYGKISQELLPDRIYSPPPQVRQSYKTLNLSKEGVTGYGTRTDLIVTLSTTGYKLDLYVWNREATKEEFEKLENFRRRFPKVFTDPPKEVDKKGKPIINYITTTHYPVDENTEVEEFSQIVVSRAKETLKLLKDFKG